MSAETPQLQILPIETKTAGTPFEGFDFLKKCVDYSSKPKSEEVPPHLSGFLIYQLEEENIVALKNPNHPSYKKLSATFLPIQEELNCNIILLVGHVNECYAYIESTDIPVINFLPTIVVIIGCFSADRIAKYNTIQWAIDRKIYFFGFDGFMHLLEGEIFRCGDPHLALPFLDCRFEEVLDDVRKIEQNATQFNKPYAEQVDLLKCCRGRYEHFKKVFYDYFPRRYCVRYNTENLLSKLRIIRDAEMSLVRNTYAMTKQEAAKYIFTAQDGEPCTEEGKCSAGKTKYNTYKDNIAKFDDRVKYGNNATKKLIAILNETSRYTPEVKAQKDKEMADLLKSLPKDTALNSLVFRLSYQNEDGFRFSIPLFFYLFAENYKLSYLEVLKNHDVPYDYVAKTTTEGSAMKLTLLEIILDHVNFRYKKPTLTEQEAYRLINLLSSKMSRFVLPETRTLLMGDYTRLPILKLLFLKFSPLIQPVNYIPFAKMFVRVSDKEINIADALKMAELSVSFGKVTQLDREKSNENAPEVYSFIYEIISYLITYRLPIPFELVVLIYTYLNDPQYPNPPLDYAIQEWTTNLERARERNKTLYRKILNAFKLAKDFFATVGGVESIRNTEAQMKELLEYDLREFESKAASIEEIKSYFGTVQKDIQKRKNLDSETKIKAIQDLVATYKGINTLKNEGENAQRRLQLMRDYYDMFLSKHPRANIRNPTVSSLQEKSKPTITWLFQKTGAYLVALKKAKQKATRRLQRYRTFNVNTLQREIQNITKKLNNHNSGRNRMHGATVRSLRKKKELMEAYLREVTAAASLPTPPPSTNALERMEDPSNTVEAPNPNGNIEYVNTLIGGRRTRKHRR